MMKGFVDNNVEIHSVMVIRHGKVAYEAFRAPYGPDIPHVMFSVSKSVTSCAIGFAVEEGLLSLDDLVVDLVPELAKEPEDPNMAILTVRHLLTMTSGKVVSIMLDKSKTNWIEDFRDAKWSYPPGEGWNYSNENIYMLCVILTRVCGMSVVDYLMPRLFEPLGIPRPLWETDANGIESGGWGIYLTTESFAKFVLCYTQGGVFEGKQVVPAKWVEESGKEQSMQVKVAEGDIFACNGYGYCMWLNPAPGGYRMDGVFSQFGIVFPEQGACMITTAGEAGGEKILKGIFGHLPAMFEPEEGAAPCDLSETKLPAYEILAQAPRNEAMEAVLENKMIFFPPPVREMFKLAGYPIGVMPMQVFFMSRDKAGGIDKVRLRFQENTLKFSWSEGAERNTVLCGMDGRNRKCLVTLGGIAFTCACCAAWNSGKLHIWIRPLNSVAGRKLTFSFHGREVSMLPRTSPDLVSVSASLAPFAADWIPNPAMGLLVTNMMDKIVGLAEPLHIGFMRTIDNRH
jgi:CubicO group peptidase (beta-lactamase class C family)